MPEPAVKQMLNALPGAIFQQLSTLNAEKKVRWTDYTTEVLGFCTTSLPRPEDLKRCFATFSQIEVPWADVKNKSTFLKRVAIQVADERNQEEKLDQEREQREARVRRDAAEREARARCNAAEEEKEKEQQRKQQKQADKDAKREAEDERRQKDHDAAIKAGPLLYVPLRGPCKGRLGELEKAKIVEEAGQFFLVFVLDRHGKSYVARKFSIPALRTSSPADKVAGTHLTLGPVGKWLPPKRFELKSTSVPKLKGVWFDVKKVDEAEIRRKEARQQNEASKRVEETQAAADAVKMMKAPADRQPSDDAGLLEQLAKLAREKRASDAKLQALQAAEREREQLEACREADQLAMQRQMAAMQQQMAAMQEMQRTGTASSSSSSGRGETSSGVKPVATPASRADVTPAAAVTAESESSDDDDCWTKEEQDSDDQQTHSDDFAGGGQAEESELDESQDFGVSVKVKSRQISLGDDD